MSPLSRRAILRTLGASFAGGIAGCSMFDRDSSATPRLGKIEIKNYDSRPHTVQILLALDDEPVYWTAEEASAGEDEDPGYSFIRDFPVERNPYDLYIRVDSQPTSEWIHYDFREYDSTCLALLVDIGQYETGNVVSRYTLNEHECEDANQDDQRDTPSVAGSQTRG